MKEVKPEDEEVYIVVAWCYREQGQYSRAIEMLNQAKRINPKSSWIYS